MFQSNCVEVGLVLTPVMWDEFLISVLLRVSISSSIFSSCFYSKDKAAENPFVLNLSPCCSHVGRSDSWVLTSAITKAVKSPVWGYSCMKRFGFPLVTWQPHDDDKPPGNRCTQLRSSPAHYSESSCRWCCSFIFSLQGHIPPCSYVWFSWFHVIQSLLPVLFWYSLPLMSQQLHFLLLCFPLLWLLISFTCPPLAFLLICSLYVPLHHLSYYLLCLAVQPFPQVFAADRFPGVFSPSGFGVLDFAHFSGLWFLPAPCRICMPVWTALSASSVSFLHVGLCALNQKTASRIFIWVLFLIFLVPLHQASHIDMRVVSILSPNSRQKANMHIAPNVPFNITA